MNAFDSDAALQAKIDAHCRFWDGQGPSLILIPAGQLDLYDTQDYRRTFADPRLMWESETRRAKPLVDWPSDGIPTVRPNLGVVFVPAMAGLPYSVRDGQMPWPGEPLAAEAILAARDHDLATAELMQRVAEFYAVHRRRGSGQIAAYHADTQGVFDIAHLLWGQSIFFDLADPDRRAWVDELLDICLELYVAATRQLKQLLGEEPGSMIHGHGAPQGVYFPHAGARIAEDTAILLSPAMIDEFVLPRIERCLAPFGGGFAHFCGHHEPLFQRLCDSERVRAVDLGNPEMWDTRWLMERAAETGTVLHSRLAAEPGESWQAYTRRLAGLACQTGARCILRPVVFPSDRDGCRAMRELWHELTA